MKISDFQKTQKILEKALDADRYQHTIGVAYTSVALAMRYEESLESAYLAGLLHDCAKCLSNDKKLSLCAKYHIEISDAEKQKPSLLHAKVGSFLASEQYQVTDQNVIMAIRSHTTGRPDMSTLEKIVFLADYIEPGRDQAPLLNQIRKLAFEDLDCAVARVLSDTLDYLRNAGGIIDPMTQRAYEFYCGSLGIIPS